MFIIITHKQNRSREGGQGLSCVPELNGIVSYTSDSVPYIAQKTNIEEGRPFCLLIIAHPQKLQFTRDHGHCNSAEMSETQNHY